MKLIYAAVGGLLMLLGAGLVHHLLARVVGMDINAELKAGNLAVGLAVMGLFIAVGLGGGLVIGLALH